MKDVHSWAQPPVIAGLRLVEFPDLLLKHGEKAPWRFAGLETVSERVPEKILLGAFFVRFKGITEH